MAKSPEAVHPIAVEARRLTGEQRHQAALTLLEGALTSEPNHPDLLVERGMLLCLLQREDEAVEALEKGGASSLCPELGARLATYFHRRALMASKLKVKDEKGKALAKRVATAYVGKATEGGIRLSACLIVKNEEKHLERCLRSLAGHVDEIVVVDTGSSDRTVEIALAFGAKIAEFAWCDDFSAARNVSLALASGDWALWIDADEEIAPESWGPIREALIRPHFGGFFVRIVNFMDEQGDANTYTHAPVRFFQLHPEVRFEGRVHEQVTPSLDRLGLPCAQLGNATIHHYGYRPSDMEEKSKLQRTVSLLEREVREAPEDAFHWFNLANAYSVARRAEDAIHAARMCLRHLHPGNSFGTVAFQILASGLNAVGKPEEALLACDEAENRGHFSILNQFERAHALLKLARLDEALAAIESCILMPWDETMTGDYGIVTHKARTLRGQILGEMDRMAEAFLDLDEALKVDPNFPIALHARAYLLEKCERNKEAAAEYRRLFGDPQFDFHARLGAARTAAAIYDWEGSAEAVEPACRTYPLSFDCWAAWIGALEAIGDAARRTAAYQSFSELHEPGADLLVNWGRALKDAGEVEAAYEKLRRATQVEPENANAHFNLGDFLYGSGLYADAAQCYEAGLKTAPECDAGWFVLGNAFAQMEIWEGARLAYFQALELNPQHEEARHNLAVVEELSRAA